MPTPDFRFEVDEAFAVTGRGTGLVGRLVAGSTSTGEPLCLLGTDGSALRVEDVTVELLYRAGSDQAALMLKGVTKDQVPPGSVLLACDFDAQQT